MERIAFLVPSRGRPSNMERLVNSIYENAAEPKNVDVWFRLDDDDNDSLYKAMDLFHEFGNVYARIGPRIVLSEMTNELHDKAKKICNIFCYLGDDCVVRTKEFDNIVREEFNKVSDRLILLYGSDGYNPNTATYGFVHRNFTKLNDDKVFDTPYLGDYCDTHITSIFKNIERFVISSNLFIEHMHPAANKANWDKTYNEKNQRCYSGVPCQIQFQLNASKREQIATKLRQHLQYSSVKKV